MFRSLLLFILIFLVQNSLYASPVKIPSKHSLEDTVKRYAKALQEAEVPLLQEKIFEKKLPGGFSKKGKEIQFSNPFYGWSLGECHRGVRKDKPMITRVWQDTNNQVWLEYMAPEDHVNNFGVIECGNETDKVRRALSGFADSATSE